MPKNNHHLTLEDDIIPNAVTSSDIHACPTRVLSLENTLDGLVLPLSECRRIAAWARSQSPPILTYLDGARLWDAVASGAGSLRDYCACFDAVSLCFSKGLGAPLGSILVSSKPLIARARHVRKSLGGGLRQSGVAAAPALVAVRQTFLGDDQPPLSQGHRRAADVLAAWRDAGGPRAATTLPVETNMVWLDLGLAGCSEDRLVRTAAEEGVKLLGARVVAHYQVGDEAIARLRVVFRRVFAEREDGVEDGREARGAGSRYEQK